MTLEYNSSKYLDPISFRKEFRGLIGVRSKVPVRDSASLSTVYTPGVGQVCLEIQKHFSSSYKNTCRGNTIAIISDGSMVSSLGNIGPYSVLPILESTAVLIKKFSGIDAFPLPLNSSNIDDIVNTILLLEPTFAGFVFQGLTLENQEIINNQLSSKLKVPYTFLEIEEESIQNNLAMLPDLPDTDTYLLSIMFTALLFRVMIDSRSWNEEQSFKDESLKIFMKKLNKIIHCIDNTCFDTESIFVQSTIIEKMFHLAESNSLIEQDYTPEQLKAKFLDFHFKEKNYSWVPFPSEKELDENTSYAEKSVLMHERNNGVIEVSQKPQSSQFSNRFIVDSGFIAAKKIHEGKENVYDLTCKNNMVAVLTDGTAVLGLGDIGPTSGLPVMEGKSVLFKTLGAVEAFPICVDTKDVQAIVKLVNIIEPVFGGINLEDISAPRCFAIEETLKKESPITIFHDDQHGTAVVVLAGLINALKYTGKIKENVKIVMNGAGAGAIAVAKLLIADGMRNIYMCDTKGAIYKGRTEGMNEYKQEIANLTNPENKSGTLYDVLKEADIFIGLSKGNLLSEEMVKSMNPEPIIFALANPYPEILPDLAYKAGAKVVATGRSDYPNQVNNSIAFPGIFRGALDVRASHITDEMKVAAAYALANLVKEEELTNMNIIPHALELQAPIVVAKAVAQKAIETKLARKFVEPSKISNNLKAYLYGFGELKALK